MQSAAQSKRERDRREKRARERKREMEKESALLLARSIHTTQPPSQPPTHTYILYPIAQPLDHCVALTRQRHLISSALPMHAHTHIDTMYIEWTILISIVLIKRSLLFLPSFQTDIDFVIEERLAYVLRGDYSRELWVSVFDRRVSWEELVLKFEPCIAWKEL